ncbi:MAG: DUF2117 domain-containing protein [Methanomicrobiales archaeon]|nr:DUF2117 domain-containing protein [Methanomicrobiales archaeon]
MTNPGLNNPHPFPAVMVVHGPEVFDHGDAAWLLARIRPASVIVAGVMARTAAEESALDVVFDSRPPSQVITGIDEGVFLLNRGKTPQSGRIFGEIVASRLPGRGLVHVECSSHTVYCWDGGNAALAQVLADHTGFVQEHATSASPDEKGTRTIRGCIPGEPVFVNGIVIGRAAGDEVVLRMDHGTIVPVRGLVPKAHGMEKLLRSGVPDISTAWCKSGAVRASAARPGSRARRSGQIVVIDHCGHTIYSRIDDSCSGVLAIGDDTTAVCGHICTHRGIPVLGVTDQDADSILPSAFAPGSVIVDTRPERDDDVGVEIAAMVVAGDACWDDWVGDVLDRFSSRVTVVLDLREARP